MASIDEGGPTSGEGDEVPPLSHILAVYQVLGSRISSSLTVVWTVPALGLSAQAFLIGASTQPGNSLPTNILLAVAILAIGVVTTFASQRVHNSVITDRLLLDRYERLLLLGSYATLGLRHGAQVAQREEQLGILSPRVKFRDRLRLSSAIQIAGSRAAWGYTLLTITLIGAIIPLLRTL